MRDQKIFSLDLSVEATSLYLLLADADAGRGHMERGTPVPLTIAHERWNAGDEALQSAFDELANAGVLTVDGDGVTLHDASRWK